MPTIDSTSATIANPPTRYDSERGRSTARATRSSIVATLENGSDGSRSRTVCLTAGSTARGSALVRTRRYRDGVGMLDPRPAIAVYTVPASGLSSPAYLTSLTTPTTVVHGHVEQP